MEVLLVLLITADASRNAVVGNHEAPLDLINADFGDPARGLPAHERLLVSSQVFSAPDSHDQRAACRQRDR